MENKDNPRVAISPDSGHSLLCSRCGTYHDTLDPQGLCDKCLKELRAEVESLCEEVRDEGLDHIRDQKRFELAKAALPAIYTEFVGEGSLQRMACEAWELADAMLDAEKEVKIETLQRL